MSKKSKRRLPPATMIRIRLDLYNTISERAEKNDRSIMGELSHLLKYALQHIKEQRP